MAAVFTTVIVSCSSTTVAAKSPWIPIDTSQTPTNVGFGVVVGLGAGNIAYSVRHTYQDVNDPSITPTEYDHTTVSGKTANAEGSYLFPVRGVRLVVTSASKGGSGGEPWAALSIIQVGH